MKTIYICFDPDTREVHSWGSNPFPQNNAQIEVEDNHEILFYPMHFVYSKGEIIRNDAFVLERERRKKDLELNKACNAAIVYGFTHTIEGIEYHFSYDIEAQGNFRDAQTVLSKGVVEEITWTVRKDGEYTRIPITKEIMDELTLVILQHKDNNISKYRDFLMPLVNQSEEVEEIRSITW